MPLLQGKQISPSIAGSGLSFSSGILSVIGGSSSSGSNGLILYNDLSTSSSTASTSDQVLKTYTLPANTLTQNGERLKIRTVFDSPYVFQVVKLQFGTYSHNSTHNTQKKVIEVCIERKSSSLFLMTTDLHENSNNSDLFIDVDSNVDWTSSIVIESIGQSSNGAAGDVVCYQLEIEKIGLFGGSGSNSSLIFADTTTIAFTQSGLTVSSHVVPGSLTASLLNSTGGATAGYVLSVNTNGTFNWIQSSSVGSTQSGLKYIIESSETVIVPLNTQYWIYGDLTIRGQLLNYGEVIIADGNLVLNGFGTYSTFGSASVTFVKIANIDTFFGDTTTIAFTQSGPTTSSYVRTGSLTASLLNSTGGATAGYVLSVNANGTFNWIQSSGGGSTQSGLKYIIEESETIVVPLDTQYWIYGDLTIRGELTNYGEVIIADGDLVLDGFGTYSSVGSASVTFVDIRNVDTVFGNTTTIAFTHSGVTVSAYIVPGSLTASLLNSTGGATAGYILSVNSTGIFDWINNTSTSTNAWSITGNTGTSASINFIGSTNLQDFVIRTNNIERLRITDIGSIKGTVPVGAGGLMFQIEDASTPGQGVYISSGSSDGVNFLPIVDFRPGGVKQAAFTTHIPNAGDSGSLPVMDFRASKVNGSVISTRPLFRFGTGDGGSFVEKAIMLANGFMGFGTASPTTLVQVAGSGSTGFFQALNLTPGSGAGGVIDSINPGSSPYGSRVSLTSPGGRPGLVIERGDGSGGVSRRWDYSIDTDDSYRIKDTTAGVFRLVMATSGYSGFGTSSPIATVDIHGASGSTLRIIDNNQGAGKVLTSDINGQASWQDPTGGGSTQSGLKYIIESSETVIVPLNTQYWIYGDLTIRGQLTNYGEVVIADGNLVLSGSGTYSSFGSASVTFVEVANPVFGSLVYPFVNISSTHSITSTNSTINCIANTFSVTLPTAIGAIGRVYIIKNSGSGTITLDTTLSQTIDGVTFKTLNQYDSYTVQSDSANWIII